MAGGSAKAATATGFLTVVRHATHGLLGGYLVTNAAGRPLEFHCTAPVKPNRAQEILFGPTLEPYLYGEQIGRALVEKASAPVALVLTDVAAALAARGHVAMPVALVTGAVEAAQADASAARRVDGAHSLAPGHVFQTPASNQPLLVASEYASDESAICSAVEALAEGFDLAEPFQRIREALEEAQRSGR